MRNIKDQLTGAHYLKDRKFIQILEGSKLALQRTIRRIVNDNRHSEVDIRLDREITKRTLGNRSMMLIGNDHELARMVSWYWSDAAFDPVKVTGEKLFGFLNIACHPNDYA